MTADWDTIANDFKIYSQLVVSGLSILACILLFILMLRDGWNRTLASLLILVTIYSVSQCVDPGEQLEVTPKYSSYIAIGLIAENLAHWLVTETYL